VCVCIQHIFSVHSSVDGCLGCFHVLALVNWYSHYGELYGGGSFKKLKIELPYDSAIPLLGIYLEENMVQMDTCTLIII